MVDEFLGHKFAAFLNYFSEWWTESYLKDPDINDIVGLEDYPDITLETAEESGEASERRPFDFDQDIDLKANQFDEALKKNMMKMAAKIDNRFSSGSQKFL